MARIENRHQKKARLLRELVEGRMKSNKLSKTEVARCMGMSQQAFSYRFLNGKIISSEFFELLEIVGITAEDLQRILG